MQKGENHHFRWLYPLIQEVEEKLGKPPQHDPAHLSTDPLIRQRRLGHRVQRIKKCRVKVIFKAGHTFRVPIHRIPDLTLYLWAKANRITQDLVGLESGLHLVPRNGRGGVPSMLLQASIDEDLLLLGEWKLFDGWLKGVPNILNELDSLRNAQPLDRFHVDLNHIET